MISVTVFWERFQELCKQKGVSPHKVVTDLGLSSGVLTHWSKRDVIPRNATLKNIADYFSVSTAYFNPKENVKGLNALLFDTFPSIGTYVLPVVGSVRAGYGSIPVEEQNGDYATIPSDQLKGYPVSDCRIIRVRGDSMYPRVMEGDLIVVHLQNEVDSGDVAVVFNGDDEATLKKVRICDDHIELIPANGKYETKIVAGKDLAECRIYGKVLSLIRDF